MFTGGKSKVAFLGLHVAAELAAQQAACQRAPDHQAHAFAAQHRRQLALQVASGDGVVGLQRFETGQAQALRHAECLHDLPCGPVRHAHVAHVALLHQRVERAQRFLHGRGRIEAMQLVQVDVLHLQALQARLYAVHDVMARVAARIGPLGAGGAEHLGGHDHVLAWHLEVLECLAGDDLRAAVRIDVGGVDEVDAGVERAADQRIGLGLLQRADGAPHAALAAEGHGAEAEFRNEQAGAAEFSVAHGGIPS
jgi:hypothetical protein